MEDRGAPVFSIAKDRVFRRWYVAALVGLLALIHLSAFVDRLVITLIFPALKTSLSIDNLQLGLLEGTAFALVFGLASPMLSWWAARHSRQRLILAGLCVWTLAGIASGVAQSFTQFALSRMMMGLGEAALAPAALSLLAEAVPPQRLGRAISVFTTGSTLGKSIALLGGGALLGLLQTHAGWRASTIGHPQPWRAMLVLIALPNLALLAAWSLVREPGRAQAWPGAEQSRTFAWLRRHRSAFVLHVLAAIMPVLLVQSLAAWIPSFYVRRFSLGLSYAGLLLGSVVLVGAPLGHLAGGAVMDALRRIGAGPGGLICVALLASIPTGCLCLLTHSLWVSLAAYGVLVMLLGMCGPAGLAGLQAMSPNPSRTKINGLFYVVVAVAGLGLAPPLVGWLSEVVFPQRDGLGYALLSVLCTGALIGAAAAWRSRMPWAEARLAAISHAPSAVLA